jgi:uncharacterized protein YebE (UPF0316 family)
MATAALGGILIFFMRVCDMSLDTLRMLFVVCGRKLLAGGIGVVQAAVFILAVSAVLKGPLNVWSVLGYSFGFAAGVLLGMYAEERLAIGYDMFRIYSPVHGAQIAQALRDAGHGATEIQAAGKDGVLTVVNCAVQRKAGPAVYAVIAGVDANAFVTVDEVRPLQHGYFRH